jgi:hypothetical protein
MKSIILAAAVTAFEFAFLVSIATPPAETASTAQLRSAGPRDLAQGARSPVPCTPPG